MKKGSITPFCAMSLMLVASLLFALLELGRVYGLDCYADMKAETGIDSVCGEYHPFLWQQYGLLFLDGAYGTEYFSMNYVTESLENYLDKNCNTDGWIQEKYGLDLFRLEAREVQLEGHALATDENGNVFLKYVAEREKERLPMGVVEDLYDEYKNTKNLQEEHDGVGDATWKALQALSDAEAEWVRKQEEAGAEEYTKPDTTTLRSILSSIGNIQSSGTLQMIFEDLSTISQSNVPQSLNLQAREKTEGNLRYSKEVNWYDKVLVLNYIGEFFSNYTNKKQNHFWDYEMEYVICGKNSDWENLDGALDRVLAIREAANVAYLLRDKEKMAEAESLAGVVGVMAGGNAGVVKVIQTGIIGVWAYMESVLDVRELLSGGYIPLIKRKSEWTTEMSNFFSAFQKDTRAKRCEEGLTYTDYLKQILFLQKNAGLAYRMMEAMEISMCRVEDYAKCRMHQMIVALQYRIKFESSPLFSGLIIVGEGYDGNYCFSKEVERSYVP